MILNRRHLLAATLSLPALAKGTEAKGAKAKAAEAKTVRVGFQKGEPILMATKANRDLETLLGPKRITVEWIEFQFGPPLLEAMRVGSIDVGAVGDTPPIFAQAAQANLLYIAANRGAPQSILLPPGSPIQTIADLNGKKLAFGRGSAAHNFALMVLEKANLRYDQIEPAYLGPADAGAAFQRGAIDAWSIWEPYTALFVTRPGVHTLTTNKEIGEQFSFIMANAAFVHSNPALAGTLVDSFAATARQARGHQDTIAALLAGPTGIPQDVWVRALAADPFQVEPMNDALTRSQQQVADRFRAQGLIPVDIKVADIVWRPTV